MENTHAVPRSCYHAKSFKLVYADNERCSVDGDPRLSCLRSLILGATVAFLLASSVYLTVCTWKEISLHPHFGKAVFHSECMQPMGGGLIAPKGRFKPMNDSTVSPECAAELATYFDQEDGQYWVDVARVAESARQYFDNLALTEPPTRDKVIVFDIDETLIFNPGRFPQQQLQTYMPCQVQKLGRRWLPGSNNICKAHEAAAAAAAAASSTSRQLPDVDQGAGVGVSDRPPLSSMLALYQYLYALGYSTSFISGRYDYDRASTIANLEDAGYGNLCQTAPTGEGAGPVDAYSRLPSTACYVALLLRNDEDAEKPASMFKPQYRARLMAQGYTIYGNFGDQFSDLDGPNEAPHSFKLPNPGYLIL